MVTHEHAKAWVKKGYLVTLFTSSFIDANPVEMVDGVEVIRRGNQILSVQWEAFKWYLFQNKKTFDLVIDQFHGLPFFTPLYIKTKKLAFIHEVTKNVWKYNVLKEPYHSIVAWIGQSGEPWIFKLLYKTIPFWTVSDSTRTELIDFGILKKNITVVPNGVTIYPVKKSQKDQAITFIGAIAEDKGIEDAIKTFALLKDLKLKFWVIGRYDDNYFKKILKLTKKLGIEKKVRFWGYVSERKKFELLQKSLLVVNPSVREGWGLTVIEAGSVSTPTIAYNVSGLKDAILHKKTGFLVDNRSSVSIAAAIRDILGQKRVYYSMQKAVKKWADSFSWPKSTRLSLHLLKSQIDHIDS